MKQNNFLVLDYLNLFHFSRNLSNSRPGSDQEGPGRLLGGLRPEHQPDRGHGPHHHREEVLHRGPRRPLEAVRHIQAQHPLLHQHPVLPAQRYG